MQSRDPNAFDPIIVVVFVVEVNVVYACAPVALDVGVVVALRFFLMTTILLQSKLLSI